MSRGLESELPLRAGLAAKLESLTQDLALSFWKPPTMELPPPLQALSQDHTTLLGKKFFLTAHQCFLCLHPWPPALPCVPLRLTWLHLDPKNSERLVTDITHQQSHEDFCCHFPITSKHQEANPRQRAKLWGPAQHPPSHHGAHVQLLGRNGVLLI